MPDFVIRFETQAQLEGAKQTLAAIDQLRQATAKAGKEVSHGDFSKLGRPDASNPLHSIHTHVRAINAEFALLGTSLPEVGHLFHLLFSPQAALIGGVSLAIGEAIKQMKEMAERMEKLRATTLEMPGLVNVWQAQSDAIKSAASASEDYKRHLEQAIAAQRTLSDQISTTVDRLKEQADAQDKINKSQDDSIESAVKAAEASGAVSKQDAEKLRFELVMRERLADHQKQMLDLTRQRQALEAAKSQAGAAQATAPEHIKTLETAAKLAEDNLSRLQKDISNAKALLAGPEMDTLPAVQSEKFKLAAGHPEWTSMSSNELGALREQLREQAKREIGMEPGTSPAENALLQLKPFMVAEQAFERLASQAQTARDTIRQGEASQEEAESRAKATRAAADEARKKADEAAAAFTTASKLLDDLANKAKLAADSWNRSFSSMALSEFRKDVSGTGTPSVDKQLPGLLRQSGATSQEILTVMRQFSAEQSAIIGLLRQLHSGSATRAAQLSNMRTDGNQ